MGEANVLSTNLDLFYNNIESFDTLNMLPIGSKATVKSLKASGLEHRRLLDLGMVEGTQIEAVLKSPLGDPVAYNIRGALIALRNEDAAKIELYK